MKHYLSATLIALTAFSGLIKWIPIPIDITVLLATLTSLSLIPYLMKPLPRFSRMGFLCLSANLIFIFWCFFSIIYTISPDFWGFKASVLFLNILCLIYPLLAFRQEGAFRAFENVILLLSFSACIIVWEAYLFGDLDYILKQGYDKEDSLLPNYLNISMIIALGAQVKLNRLTFVSIPYALFCFSTIALLGARGPFLFLFLVSLVYARVWLQNEKDRVMRFLGRASGLSALIVCAWLVLNWQGAMTLTSRLAAFAEFEDPLTAAGRDEIVDTALYVIEENWLLGTGLGGYGLAGYGLDANIYPHNLFLESMAEAGIIGLFMFSISIISGLLLAYSYYKTPAGLLYGIMFLFVLLNYMKSGGFVGARDLYLTLGALISYVNMRRVIS